MSGKGYWKNRLPFLLVNGFCMAALTVFLLVNGNSADSIALILMVWVFLLTVGLVFSFRKRKKELEGLLQTAEQLKERYLIPEVMEKPERAEDQVFYRILKLAGKSMLERVGDAERERREYREYIEQWVHEIRTPITAMKLLCENNRMQIPKELFLELEKTDRLTEQVLYYARSGQTQKDYSVREMDLTAVVHQAIADNKYLLLQNSVRIEMEEAACMVFSDDKWVRFILDQLIVNAVKYRSDQPVLCFEIEDLGNRVILCVGDNGIGIPAGDLPRIFEKGFTGENGRAVHSSTGMGLYLCKKLCDKLGIGIDAASDGQGTQLRLVFLRNDFVLK